MLPLRWRINMHGTQPQPGKLSIFRQFYLDLVGYMSGRWVTGERSDGDAERSGAWHFPPGGACLGLVGSCRTQAKVGVCVWAHDERVSWGWYGRIDGFGA
jgi:hypothetical protein